MDLYLYAIVERLPARWAPPSTAIAGAPVVSQSVGDLVVVGSLVDDLPRATPQTLAIHHAVVETAMCVDAVVPCRYGTVLLPTQLEGWLTTHTTTLRDALDTVRGRVEMNVKLLRLDCSPVPGSSARARLGDATAPDALQALGEQLVERAGIEAWRYRPVAGNGNVAASVAFLVPRTDVPSFLSRIAPVASHATGVAVVPTGPWPAYSFVPDFDRLPPARIVKVRPDDRLSRRPAV